AAVRKVFTEALEYQPSLIIIDELQAIAGKTQSGSLQIDIASIIGSELDRLDDSRVLVVAATRRPNEIDESLRKRGRLRFEIDIPIPDTNARIEILKVLRGLSLLAADELSEGMGQRTHGFVGSDLEDLVEVAEEIAQDRHEAQSSSSARLHEDTSQSQVDDADLGEDSDFQVRQEDFESALLRVRPSAMREVFLDSPKVRWNDIGGQEDVKETLRQLVEWPIRDAAHMAWLGISPKKGLLLYGPPGCSKTLTAQALATEAGLNFIAVKGAELLSMYVGESERAVREVFRKARAASPSIIFFDEIDAIGASREGGGQGSGVNVLTTILNEMDGIEQLKGVLVLAATNKPEVLDPALMRPGRLGTALYVGPPDLAARTEILRIQSRKMKFGEDVDIDDLASRSEGYSGAEMVYVCEEAGSGAMTEYEREGVKVKICKRHFDSAVAKVPMQITREVRARYENWSVGGVKKL
ncbi:MAG: AAA+-type ATPase, partial [Candelina submexicana]